MEKEIGNSLEREDRESVFDDVVAPDPSLEGIDYATYLKIERGEMTIEEWKKQSSQDTQVEVSKPEMVEACRKLREPHLPNKETKKEDEVAKREKRLTIVTTEDVWKLLKIVAASEGKTVSTYLNDFILHSLKAQLEQAKHYSRSLLDVNDTG